MKLVEIKDLSVVFEGRKKLDCCNLNIYENEVIGLVGPNGSGKTTLIKTMLGFYNPSLGYVSFYCKREDVGYVPQQEAFFEDYTVEENIRFFAVIQNCETRVKSILEDFSLVGYKNIKAGKLSGGWKKVLNIAISMVKPIKFLILDEPTANVDLAGRKRIMRLVQNLRKSGISVLFTTHQLDEVEILCDRVAVISAGKICTIGTVYSLINRYGGEYSISAKTEYVEKLKIALEEKGFEPIIKENTIMTIIPKKRGNKWIAIALYEYSRFPVRSLHLNEPSFSKAINVIINE